MLSSKNINKHSSHTLIFFPFAGGSGEVYIPWFKHFEDTEIDCRYAMLKGRGRLFDEPAVDDIEQLVDSYISVLLNLSHQPFSLFGHSMGALIAFELSRKLFDLHAVLPKNLFVSGFRAPCLQYNRLLLHKMNKPALLKNINNIGKVDSLPKLNDIELDPFLPTIYNDLKLHETYEYREAERMSTDFTVLWGEEDLYIQKENIELWRNESVSEVKFHSFKGGHFYLFDNSREVISIIKNKIIGGT